MSRTYRTTKGTELPLLNLRDKEYLEVKYRLVWFREDHPDWRTQTEIISHDKDNSLVCAKIFDSSCNLMSMAHKTEDRRGFPDHLEKCETSAIGRALALVGYGTQFCADELDEGERIVDSPVEPKIPASLIETPKAKAPVIAKPEWPSEGRGGDYVIVGAKKVWAGRTIKDVADDMGLPHFQKDLDWWVTQSGARNSASIKSLKHHADLYFDELKAKNNPFLNSGLSDEEEARVEAMIDETRIKRHFIDDPNPTTIGERMNRK